MDNFSIYKIPWLMLYMHTYFFWFPFQLLFIFPQSCHICFSSLPLLSLQLWPGCSRKKISLVTYEVICLSLNNDCECKTPASWNMFALWRWSRLFSSCPRAFFFFPWAPRYLSHARISTLPCSTDAFSSSSCMRTGCSYWECQNLG